MKARVFFLALFLYCAQWVGAAESLVVGERVSELMWRNLVSTERVILAPLEPIWPSFTLSQRREWLRIAARYPTLEPVEQQRLQQRMWEWARMSSAQRRAARKNFQASRMLSPAHKAEAWSAYQALPEEHKQALARRAVKNKAKSVVSASPPVHPAGQELTHITKRKQALRRSSQSESPVAIKKTPLSPPSAVVVPSLEEKTHE